MCMVSQKCPKRQNDVHAFIRCSFVAHLQCTTLVVSTHDVTTYTYIQPSFYQNMTKPVAAAAAATEEAQEPRLTSPVPAAVQCSGHPVRRIIASKIGNLYVSSYYRHPALLIFIAVATQDDITTG